MTEKKATRRCGNNRRVRVSSTDYPIIPDWAALLIGVGLGWPFIWWAVMM